MITRAEDFGDGHAAEFDRFGVGGGFEEIRVAEGLGLGGGVVSQGTGKQADDGITEDGGCEGAVGEDVIADGNFFVDQCLDDAVVDTFIVATEEDEVGMAGEAGGGGLIVTMALWGEKNDAGIRTAQRLDRGKERFGAQQHAGPSAKGGGIDAAVFVLRPIAELVDAHIGDPGVARAADDGIIERCKRDFGK